MWTRRRRSESGWLRRGWVTELCLQLFPVRGLVTSGILLCCRNGLKGWCDLSVLPISESTCEVSIKYHSWEAPISPQSHDFSPEICPNPPHPHFLSEFGSPITMQGDATGISFD